jgi:hypothetical protein
MPKEFPVPSAVRFLWQQKIEAAVNESDPKKRPERVYDAEAAIFSRLQELAQNWEAHSIRKSDRPLRMPAKRCGF